MSESGHLQTKSKLACDTCFGRHSGRLTFASTDHPIFHRSISAFGVKADVLKGGRFRLPLANSSHHVC